MEETGINVPINVRTHETQQLQTKVPSVIEDMQDADMDTDEIERVYDEHIAGLNGTGTVSMPTDDWQIINTRLARLDNLHTRWLRKKLVRRLRERLEELE